MVTRSQINHDMTTTVSLVTTVTMQTCCSIIDCIPYSVHYIPVTCLFYNRKFVQLNHLHLFHPTLITLPSGDHHFVLCIYESVSLLSSTYK